MCTFYDYTNRWRTQSDRTANAIRLDGGRNPIGRRTQSDRAADAIRSNSLIIYRVKLVFVTKHNLQFYFLNLLDTAE